MNITLKQGHVNSSIGAWTQSKKKSGHNYSNKLMNSENQISIKIAYVWHVIASVNVTAKTIEYIYLIHRVCKMLPILINNVNKTMK